LHQTFLQAKTFTKKHFFFLEKRKPVLKEKIKNGR